MLSDPRRRQRAGRLLDLMEKKQDDAAAYEAFLEALEDQYPHIYLALTDTLEEDEDDEVLADDIEAGSPCEDKNHLGAPRTKSIGCGVSCVGSRGCWQPCENINSLGWLRQLLSVLVPGMLRSQCAGHAESCLGGKRYF